MRHRSTVFALFLVIVAGCGEKQPASAPSPSQPRYVRPDVERLLETAVVDDAHGIDKETARDTVSHGRGFAASKALWASVERAEAEGLAELYGIEQFDLGEEDYRALMFLVLDDDRTVCLFARHDLHDARQDVGSVPAALVSRDAVAALRRRFAAELPLPVPADLTSDTDGGTIYLLHAYVGGVSHAALWYSPDAEHGAEEWQESMRRFSRAFAVHMLAAALKASAPPELFPTKEEGLLEKYAALPSIGALLGR